jgi:hypothetical protein
LDQGKNYNLAKGCSAIGKKLPSITVHLISSALLFQYLMSVKGVKMSKLFVRGTALVVLTLAVSASAHASKFHLLQAEQRCEETPLVLDIGSRDS